jgi:hypothetical protein
VELANRRCWPRSSAANSGRRGPKGAITPLAGTTSSGGPSTDRKVKKTCQEDQAGGTAVEPADLRMVVQRPGRKVPPERGEPAQGGSQETVPESAAGD